MSRPEWVDEAQRLRDAGFGYQRIANRVGTTHNTVYYWLNTATRRNARATKTCPVCGQDFPAYDLSRKFCSRDCFNASPRSDETRDRMRNSNRNRGGKKNPNYRHGKRVGGHSRDRERRFKSGQTTCQHPGCEGGMWKLHEHHVVYDQHVRREDGDRWDERNALALCASCHSRHHRRSRVLPLVALRDENYAFAAELLGEAAYYYLRRRYAGDDVRLDALLEPIAVTERNVPRVA